VKTRLVRPFKAAVKSLVGTPLGWRIARAAVRSPGLIVLMYHRVGPSAPPFRALDPADFRRQMAWLKRNCRPIAPEEIREAIRDPDRFRPPVLVTFDDGFRDYHDHAHPVLREMGIPSLVFLTTAFMDAGGMLWVDALRWAASRTPLRRLTLPGGGAAEMADAEARRAFAAAWTAHLKRCPEDERTATVERLLRELAGEAPPPAPPRQMMTWDEVRATADGARFGGHTHTHPILSRVGPEQLEAEIRTCRDRIEAETGRRPRWFAYPNGQAADFTEAVKEAVRRQGFEAAFTAIEGVNGRSTDPFALRRFSGRSPAPQMVWLRGAAG
jgi:peptidoglycan/xylan/chitin deacetylase (PgdA/CDA1 family)